MRHESTAIAMASILLAMPAAADGTNAPIARADFGDAWPFTVPAGVLNCTVVGRLSSGLEIQSVTFAVNGKVYAINGVARGHAKQNGWHEVTPIWRNNPRIPGAKVDIGPVISRGLQLCGYT